MKLKINDGERARGRAGMSLWCSWYHLSDTISFLSPANSGGESVDESGAGPDFEDSGVQSLRGAHREDSFKAVADFG
jgi:hypothetical protein